MDRARRGTIAAARAQRQKLGLPRRTRWANVTPRSHAVFSAARDLFDHASQRIPKELAAVAQNEGSKLTCQRNAVRASRPFGSAE
jgi:hypothetical protein